jgi:hypothetical protein
MTWLYAELAPIKKQIDFHQNANAVPVNATRFFPLEEQCLASPQKRCYGNASTGLNKTLLASRTPRRTSDPLF